MVGIVNAKENRYITSAGVICFTLSRPGSDNATLTYNFSQYRFHGQPDLLQVIPKISTCALKISMRPSVIPSLVRNLNLPLKSEMSRFHFAPLDMTFCGYCVSTL